MKLLLSVQRMKIRGVKMPQDNLDRFNIYDESMENKLDSLPTCDWCGEKVQDYYFEIGSEIVCETCLEKVRVSTY